MTILEQLKKFYVKNGFYVTIEKKSDPGKNWQIMEVYKDEKKCGYYLFNAAGNKFLNQLN